MQLVAELGLGEARRPLPQHGGGEAGQPQLALALGPDAAWQGNHDGDGRDLVTLGADDLDALVQLAMPDGRHLDADRLRRLGLHAAVEAVLDRAQGQRLPMLAVIRQLALGRGEVRRARLPLGLALGHHAQHHGVPVRDELVVGCLDLLGIHLADGIQVLEHIVWIPGQHLPHSQLAHLALDAVQPPDGGGTVAADGLLQIRGLDAALGKFADHLVHLPLEGLEAAIHRRVRVGVDRQGTGQLLAGVGGPYLDGLAGLDQGLIEHGAGGATEHVGKDVQRRLLRIAKGHGRVADIEQRQVHLVFQRHITGLGQDRRFRRRLGHLGATGDGAEVLLNPGQRLLIVEVTAQGQRGVVRAIPA